MPCYELIIVKAPEDWAVYHQIRRVELWEARGNFDYDPEYPDEYMPHHTPLLLKKGGVGIATTRFDLRDGNVGIIRLVAVTKTEQGKGVGRILNEYITSFAKDKGVVKICVNAAPEAVGYYEKMGFTTDTWDVSELVGIASDCIQMSLLIS